MKYCQHCGKEIMNEAVICPNCGCYPEKRELVKQDYSVILKNTKLFVAIGLVLMAIGLFAWAGTSLLQTLYVVIGEQFYGNILGTRIPSSVYTNSKILANWSSIAFFLAAEIMFIIPREKFNSTFKKENYMLLTRDKAEYKKAAKAKNQELNKQIPGYYASWVLAIAACVFFVISVCVPSLGL